MSLEKMNNMEESPQNENNNEPILLNENYLYTRNILHIIINTIINFALIITIIFEFIIRVKNNYPITNFDILVAALILFEILFICLNYFKFDINYLKGMIFYPFITCFWGLADFLSIFVLNNNHEWINADTLKVTKFSLIGLNVFINIFYLFYCKNKI